MTVEVFMKRELPQWPLRFATARAYDSGALRDPGNLWVNRSIQEFSLDKPIDALHGTDSVARGKAPAVARVLRRDELEAMYANPLRDEPQPAVVGAVKRFGLLGLVTCAMTTGLVRWWHSRT
jgi:hypothetical protein